MKYDITTLANEELRNRKTWLRLIAVGEETVTKKGQLDKQMIVLSSKQAVKYFEYQQC